MSIQLQERMAGRAGMESVAQAIADLDRWLQTMRSPRGYGGPVAHWWQSCFAYTGPGVDWRYEGILTAYRTLYERTGNDLWLARLRRAALDVMDGQHNDGTYSASQFEMNPGSLGTPHEAAATLGLIEAMPYLERNLQGIALHVAERNLTNLVVRLWDSATGGFNDRPGVPGRVPNKLATLSLALIRCADRSGRRDLLPYARAGLDDVLRYQVENGPLRGAVHQYAPGTGRGDGRFFPYYNARCIPPLVAGAHTFADTRYEMAAAGIFRFLVDTMLPDGSWPQVVYSDGSRGEWPRWIAGAADILLAFHILGKPLPEGALERLMCGRLPSGGFGTAAGFAAQITQGTSNPPPDFRDVIPVVGWNDKVFRLLASLLPPGTSVPHAQTRDTCVPVTVGTTRAQFHETDDHMSIRTTGGRLLYCWRKPDPWAIVSPEVSVK